MPCVQPSRCCRALRPDRRVLQDWSNQPRRTPDAIGEPGAVPGSPIAQSITAGASARALQAFRQRVARHPQSRGHSLG